MPPGANSHQRAKRDRIKGWTAAAVRRHTAWLYSIDAESLDDGLPGFAVTLTLRDCPPSAEEWTRLVRSWIKALERSGLQRMHWVVEWQRRGVPHLHCALYFDPSVQDGGDLACALWFTRAVAFGAAPQAQQWNPIDGPLGWLQYLSKHAARGVKHYQRTGSPEGWESTGRLWGHRGEWPVVEPSRYEVSRGAYWRLRRLVRSWRVADARSERDPRKRAQRVRYARRMLACPDPRLSPVRGVSDWIPADVMDRLVRLAVAQDAGVRDGS